MRHGEPIHICSGLLPLTIYVFQQHDIPFILLLIYPVLWQGLLIFVAVGIQYPTSNLLMTNIVTTME